MKKELYTPEEAAALLKVTVSTVRRWLRDGDLVGFKAGRQWRINITQIEKMEEGIKK